MSKKTKTHSKTIYVCDVCGYESDIESYYNSHVIEHRGQIGPFEVGDRVGYMHEEFESDWGREYRVMVYDEGTIVEFDFRDDQDLRYVLIAYDDKTRHWVGEWKLGLPRVQEPEEEEDNDWSITTGHFSDSGG